MALTRLFIAWMLADRDRLALTALQKILSAHFGRAVFQAAPPEKLHLTLRFLGSVEADLIPVLRQLLHRSATVFQPTSLRLSRFGSFGRPPRVAWIGGDFQGGRAAEAQPQTWQRDLEVKLISLGLPNPEKVWRPHITLGKLTSPPAQLAWPTLEDGPIVGLDQLALVESRLSPRGSTYHILKQIQIFSK